MDTKTIDERIREKARKELSDKIYNASREFCKVIEIVGTTDVVEIVCFRDEKQRTNESAFAYNRDLIEGIAKQAIEKLSPKHEESAIRDFLKKVDSLQGQIDEIYHSIDNEC